MQTFQTDFVIVGVGGVGLYAAIAVVQANPSAKIALISKVYLIRNHTIAAEGGSTAVAQDHDSSEYHFHDIVAGGDWLCKQDVVDCFVYHCPTEVTQLELWRCPWNRHPDGSINVRRFGGMKIGHTWFVVDRTGFHMLHTLFQTPLQFPQTQRFDEHFMLGTLADDGRTRGLIVMNMMGGTLVQIRINAAVMATGDVGHVYHYNTNGGIVTSDGMGTAPSHGAPLHDMKFVQYHPAGLPGSGILMAEGCRGEGGILVDRNGYRYLQDYGIGPETPLGEPKSGYIELSPRDKVSQAFWHEWRKGNTVSVPRGSAVYLDLRHLNEERLHERLPFICELAKVHAGVDPVREPIPVHPTAYYTMNGIETDQNCEIRIRGLFVVGECSPVGLHGANHLGSNSLMELVVFGRLAGEQATERAAIIGNGNETIIGAQAIGVERRLEDLINQDGSENWAKVHDEMGLAIEENCGIYRAPELMQEIIDKLAELQERSRRVHIADIFSVLSTDLFYVTELGHGLSVAECVAHSTVARKESRGAYQRPDGGCTERGDVSFLKHILAFRDADGTIRLEYSNVKITTLPPAKRVYGDEADATDRAEAVNKKERADG